MNMTLLHRSNVVEAVAWDTPQGPIARLTIGNTVAHLPLSELAALAAGVMKKLTPPKDPKAGVSGGEGF